MQPPAAAGALGEDQGGTTAGGGVQQEILQAQERAEWASFLASSDALIGKLTQLRNLSAQKVARG
jgi:hypothetical protein